MTTTISGTAGVTFPAGGLGNPASAVVGLTDTQTLTNKTLTTPTIDSASVSTVSGTAPLFMARAWVNFNGTGTVAIRASGNVSSITDNGTGDYTVNFTTALPDANYSCVTGVTRSSDIATDNIGTQSYLYQTTSVRVNSFTPFSASVTDAFRLCVSIFR